MSEKTFDLNIEPVAPKKITPPSSPKFDGWSNLLSGMGGSGDKRTNNIFGSSAFLTNEQLADLYMHDGVVSRIIDVPAQDAFREWGSVQNDDTTEYDEGIVTYEMNRLDARTTFLDAKRWARLFGGALLTVGAMGSGSPETPLNINKITSIEYLKVFDLGDIITYQCKFDTDMSSPNFGNIELYAVRVRSGNNVETKYIHYTRCIPFKGMTIPPSIAVSIGWDSRYWGISTIQPMYDDIRDYRGAFANTAGILQEFVTSIYKFEDLDEMLATGGVEKFQTRMLAIEQSKSLINAVLLGKEEDYDRNSATVTGLDELLDRFMMQVSAVSGIPVTRLFGRSASGLNATGEGDSKQYFDVIRAEQNKLTPEIQRFVNMIVAWKKLPEGGDYTWTWNSLFQLTAQEQAEMDRKDAERFRTKAEGYRPYLENGVIVPEDVYKLEFEAELGPRDSQWFDDLHEQEIEEQNAANTQVSNQEETVADDQVAEKSQQK